MAWSEMQRLVTKQGCKLQATVMIVPSAPLGADACLHVPATTGSFAASSMLDGPYSDMLIRCSDREFRAHRVILSATSPVFSSMLGNDMVEGQTAEVTVKEADPEVVRLLLQVMYGTAVEVPLSLAVQLYGLADQYQVESGLKRVLRVGLSTVPLAADALCKLLPWAHSLCPEACQLNFCSQAADYIDRGRLYRMPAFSSWPVDAVVEAVKLSEALQGFKAAAAWMTAQPKAAKHRHHWPKLLDALSWSDASRVDLKAIVQHKAANSVPGLQQRVVAAFDALCEQLERSCERLTQRLRGRCYGNGGEAESSEGDDEEEEGEEEDEDEDEDD